jgi:hypothetical protein
MVDRILKRAAEGRAFMADYKTPLLEGLAVALFPLAIVLAGAIR